MTKDKTQETTLNGLEELTAKIETLEADLAAAQTETETAKEAQMRALADLANFQRRETENKKLWSQFAVADFLKKVIPSFLELKLGADHSQDESIKQVVEKLWKNLETVGLTAINPAPETEVNPNEHEVLMVAEGQPGCIVQVLEPGWKLHEQVILPAKVSAAQE
ncbi:nucleotide exchange factor GrpE [bacterium DOLZORAL124_38_8]|nr:MAG: nucleotide exchange factor GrpE [bacterium DOLZORAL124_38_8]